MKFRKSRDVTDELTESEKLMLDKACALVRTSEKKHQPMLDRWLSMMNKKIHQAGGVIRDLYFRVQELEAAISAREFECSYNSTKK